MLSPSTRAYDLLLKKDRLQRAGCANYWVVDPDVPAITAWALRDGAYNEAASATGAEPLTVEQPFPISVTPASLIED